MQRRIQAGILSHLPASESGPAELRLVACQPERHTATQAGTAWRQSDTVTVLPVNSEMAGPNTSIRDSELANQRDNARPTRSRVDSESDSPGPS
jgi:hypothetical protein